MPLETAPRYCHCIPAHDATGQLLAQYSLLNFLCCVYGCVVWFVWPIDCNVKHHIFQSINFLYTTQNCSDTIVQNTLEINCTNEHSIIVQLEHCTKYSGIQEWAMEHHNQWNNLNKLCTIGNTVTIGTPYNGKLY